MMKNMLSVRDLGAIGDGVSDDTLALQKAIDIAAETGQAVFLDQGTYRCNTLQLHPEIVLYAEPTWGFRWDSCGKTVIQQADIDMECQIDLTNARGCTLRGLSLMGLGVGQCVGMLSRKLDYGEQEDSYRIEDCCVSHYGGHAVFLDHVWCFSVRHSQLGHCGGDGLRVNGWDGFVLDNWLSGNSGAGYYGEDPNCSITLTGNRIEWNGAEGIFAAGGSHYNITGNYIDRSGSAGIHLLNMHTVSCTGNVLYRNGKFQTLEENSSHCILTHCQGVTMIGNTMKLGRDDNRGGTLSPAWALCIEGLTDCVISGNAMHKSSMRGLIADHGGHDQLIMLQNAGRVSSEI